MAAVSDDLEDMPDDVQEALDIIQQIEDTIEDLPEHSQIAGSDFFEDVSEKAKSVGDTIRKTMRVTPRQRSALDGWLGGVRRWVKD